MPQINVFNNNTNPFYYDKNGIGHPLQIPSGGLSDFYNDWSNFIVVLCGGVGSSKTTTGVLKLIVAHMHNSFSPDGEWQQVDSLMILPTYKMIADPGVKTLQLLSTYIGLETVYKKADSEFVFPQLGNNKIILRTSEGYDAIRGLTVGYCLMDEVSAWATPDDPDNNALVHAKARTRDSKARVKQCLLVSTPNPNGPIGQFYDQAVDPNHACYYATTKDNPAMQEYAAQIEKTYDKKLHATYLLGQFGKLESGLKPFDNFSRELNVSADLKLTPSLPIVNCWDFGSKNSGGTYCLLCQYDPQKDCYYTIYEIIEPTTKYCCITINKLVQSLGGWQQYPQIHIGGDPAGGKVQAGASFTSFEEVKQHFVEWNQARALFKYSAKSAPRIDRVATANLRLKDNSNTPHWVIHPRCAKLIRDLEECIFEQNAKGENCGLEKRKPYHYHTHAVDAVSSWIYYHRPYYAKPTHQSLTAIPNNRDLVITATRD